MTFSSIYPQISHNPLISPNIHKFLLCPNQVIIFSLFLIFSMDACVRSKMYYVGFIKENEIPTASNELQLSMFYKILNCLMWD